VKQIEIQNIKKTYHLGEHQVSALTDVTLSIETGEFVGILGASGSGKSTLLNLMGGLDQPDSGRVLYNGQSFYELQEKEKSRMRNEVFSYIFQSFNLLPVLTVLENVMLPLLLRSDLSHQQKQEASVSIIQAVGLEKQIKSQPHQLSGGQRQRVAIARALVTGSHIVFADEPTANLDSKTAYQIIDLLINLNQNRKITFVFCTHDEKLVSKLGRKLLIQDGAILE
jgi:putative ABC transport system ATP-binding protein